MRTVLLTTNFSENSKSVSNYAISMIGIDVQYVLLHGYTLNYAKIKSSGDSSKTSDEKIEEIKLEIQSELNRERKRLRAKFPTIQIETKAKEGIGIIAIESYVREKNPDIVVIGTHMHQANVEANKITVATRLIGSIPTSILVIPYKVKWKPLISVMYAYDLIELNTNSILVLSHIFKKHKSRLTFFTIDEEKIQKVDEEVLDGVGRLVAASNIDYVFKSSEDVVSGILDYAQRSKPDLLIITARPETYLQDFWTGSKADEIATHIEQPLLVLAG